MAVRLPVVFRSGNVTKTFNRQPDGRGGEGDSIGVWREGNVAWKIFKNRRNLPTTMGYYRTAEVHGLPMGTNPKPTFHEGAVRQGSEPTDRETNGFALVTRWLVGREFNFHRPPKPFRSALRDEKISHSKTSVQYQRVLGGCNSAKAVGLIDVQGKVDGTTGAFEPVTFFDIHTTQPHSSPHATDLVDVITAWGTDR